MKVNKNTDIALIQVSGDDSADLLNNILTNDVSKVTNKNSIYSCLLSPQGKLIADLILCHFQESIILISHSGFAEDIIKTLNTYKLRSRVEINNVTNNFQYYYINYENLITSLNKNEVFNGNTFVFDNSTLFIDPRINLLGGHVISDDNTIGDHNYEITQDDIIDCYFKNGVLPSYLLKDMKKVYPLEANIHLLNGIDFKKGCYVGQEVTARMKLKNKIPKIIFPLTSDRNISNDIESDDLYGNDTSIGKIIAKKDIHYFALIEMRKLPFEGIEDIKLANDHCNFIINKQPWFTY